MPGVPEDHYRRLKVDSELPGVRYAITSNGAAVWDMGTDPLGAVYSRYSDAPQRPTP